MKKETKAHPFHINMPPDLWERFKTVAAGNRRILKEEALIAIENHVTLSEKKRKAR